jgi:hypothetical protein
MNGKIVSRELLNRMMESRKLFIINNKSISSKKGRKEGWILTLLGPPAVNSKPNHRNSFSKLLLFLLVMVLVLVMNQS